MDKSARFPNRPNNPSFSSSLLDAIFRSIDEPHITTSPSPALSSTSKPHISSINKNSSPLHLRPPFFSSSSSNSSDCSTFGGFSSSDPDSTSRPILTQRKSPSSIRSRLRDLRNPRSPASPSARLSAFLNAIFSTAGANPKKPKLDVRREELPAASRCGKQRSVRFEEKRRSGEDRRMVLEELLRGLEVEEEEESDCDSVSSSELFELDCLSVSAIGGRFGDELPVYETTDVSANRAIARGFVV